MEVQCLFEQVNEYDCQTSARLTIYICRITSASITKQFTRIRSFKGIHQNGQTDKDVRGVQFESTKVHFIPWRLTSVFPQLKYLRINNCGLKSISRKDLIGLEGLKSLELDKNQLSSLPNDLFINMSGLKQLFLCKNKLEKMSSAFLIPIRAQLEFLMITENPSMNVCFKHSSINFDVAEEKALEKGFQSISIDEIMRLIDSVCSQPESENLPDLSETFANGTVRRLKKLRFSAEYSDLTITVGLKYFEVHKNILAINSSVFSSMFLNTGMKQIKIKNYSETAVSEFLSYIYTGEVPSENNALEIYGLSVEYDIQKLKMISEDMILRNLSMENALAILEFGILQNSIDISKIAFDELTLVFPEHQLPEHFKTCLKCLKEFIVENEACAAANRRFDLFLKDLPRGCKCQEVRRTVKLE